MNPWVESYGEIIKSSNISEETKNKRKTSLKAAVIAKCYDCNAGYHDGRKDCEMVYCPLYSWMPYRKLDPDFTWTGAPAKFVRRLSKEVKEKMSKLASKRFKK